MVFFKGVEPTSAHRQKFSAGAPLMVAPVRVVQPDKAEVGHQPATDARNETGGIPGLVNVDIANWKITIMNG